MYLEEFLKILIIFDKTYLYSISENTGKRYNGNVMSSCNILGLQKKVIRKNVGICTGNKYHHFLKFSSFPLIRFDLIIVKKSKSGTLARAKALVSGLPSKYSIMLHPLFEDTLESYLYC